MAKLDEKHELVKEQVQMMYDLIKTGERALEILRKQCDHPETEYVNYMWAPGHIQPNTKICSICGEVILEEPKWMQVLGNPTLDQEIRSWDDGGCSTGIGGDQ